MWDKKWEPLSPDRPKWRNSAISRLTVVILFGHISNFFRLPSVESRKIVERYRATFKNAA